MLYIIPILFPDFKLIDYNSAEVEGEPEKYPSIVIKNSQKYANGVYTLTAVYKKQTAETTINFTTIFDLVFSRSS